MIVQYSITYVYVNKCHVIKSCDQGTSSDVVSFPDPIPTRGKGSGVVSVPDPTPTRGRGSGVVSFPDPIPTRGKGSGVLRAISWASRMQNSHVILIIVMATHCLVCGSRMQRHCGLICAAGALSHENHIS